MDENRDWQNTGTTSTEPANSSSTNNSVPVEEVPTIETDTATADGEATQMRDTGFRPLTRSERRNLWLKEYGEQDFALQMWVRLVEQQDVEIEMMFQMQGVLVFGVMVSTARYAEFYIDVNEELHRQDNPETADILKELYTTLVPAPN